MGKRRMPTAGAIIFGVLFAGFSCIFLAIGFHMAIKQQRLLLSATPVPGVVEETGLETVPGKGSPTYRPKITYRHADPASVERAADPAGWTLRSDQVHAIPESSSRGWADGIIARYPVGAQVTVWVAPDGTTYLERTVSFGPYIFILFPMIHFTVGLAMALFAGDGRTLSPAGNAKRMGIIACAWNAVGVTALVHYLACGGDLNLLASIALGIYATIGAFLMRSWIRKRRAAAGGLAAVEVTP
jgi:hypothetical protein